MEFGYIICLLFLSMLISFPFFLIFNAKTKQKLLPKDENNENINKKTK